MYHFISVLKVTKFAESFYCSGKLTDEQDRSIISKQLCDRLHVTSKADVDLVPSCKCLTISLITLQFTGVVKADIYTTYVASEKCSVCVAKPRWTSLDGDV